MRLSAENRLTHSLLLASVFGLLVLVVQMQRHQLDAALDPHHHEICVIADLHQAGHQPLHYKLPTLARTGLRLHFRTDKPASMPFTIRVTPQARSPPIPSRSQLS